MRCSTTRSRCRACSLLFWRKLLHEVKRLSVVVVTYVQMVFACAGARIDVKQNNNDSHPLLMKALGITEQSCVFPTGLKEPEPKNIVFRFVLGLSFVE